jgi:DNA-directed RNA polymerase specialized sigma subunit
MTPLTDEQSALAASGWRAALDKCRVMSIRKRVSEGDLYGPAADGLVAAAHRFCPERGVSFAVYSDRCVVGAIMDYLRNDAPMFSRRTVTRMTVDELAETGREPASTSPSPEDAVAEAEWRSRVVARAREVSAAPVIARKRPPKTGRYVTGPLRPSEQRRVADRAVKAAARSVATGLRRWEAVRMHYLEEAELSEVGTAMGGVTATSARQLILQALQAMATDPGLAELAS